MEIERQMGNEKWLWLEGLGNKICGKSTRMKELKN